LLIGPNRESKKHSNEGNTLRPTILIVDDQESISKSLKITMEREGYAVDVASNGREGVEKAKMRSYNIALIDRRLPDMDGTELLTAIRETTPKMVKIIMTGYPSPESVAEAARNGADEYIVKLFNVEDFLKTIKEYLKKQQQA